MSTARPTPCWITLHTADGPITTDSERLLKAGVAVDTDLSDPEIVMAYVTGRLQQFGHIAFTNGDGIDAVIRHAIYRITVQRDEPT